MIVYLDFLLIENLLVTLLLLEETQIFLNKKYRLLYKIVSSIISSVYTSVLLIIDICGLQYILCKLLLFLIIVYVAFKPTQVKMYLKQLFIYLSVSSINLGTIVAIENIFELDIAKYKLIVYFVSFSLSYLFIKYFWKTYKNNIMKGPLIKEVKLYANGKTYNYTGFIDTGNTAYSYEFGVPVLFAELLTETQEYDLKELPSVEIEIKTISDITKQKIYYFKYASINGKTVNVGVAFVKDRIEKNGKYNMILNYLLFENMGGISV